MINENEPEGGNATPDCTLVAILRVDYLSNGEMAESLKRLVEGNLRWAIGDGALSGESAAEVDEWRLDVLCTDLEEPGTRAQFEAITKLERVLRENFRATRPTQEILAVLDALAKAVEPNDKADLPPASGDPE